MAESSPSFIQIEIDLKFKKEASITNLPRFLGPNNAPRSAPGAIVQNAEFPIEIMWTERTSKTCFGNASLTINQNSIRGLVEDFDRYSSQLVEKIREIGQLMEIECHLVYFPNGISGHKERVDAIVWRQVRYWKEVRKILFKEFFSRVLPSLFVIIGGYILFSNDSTLASRAKYGLFLGISTLVVSAFVAPIFMRKELRREI